MQKSFHFVLVIILKIKNIFVETFKFFGKVFYKKENKIFCVSIFSTIFN